MLHKCCCRSRLLKPRTQGAGVGESKPRKATGIVDAQGFEHEAETSNGKKNVRGNEESMSANISLFDMMQSSTREMQVGGDLIEERRVEGEKAKSDEEKEEEEEEEGEEHKKTDSGSDAPVMVEASRDIDQVSPGSSRDDRVPVRPAGSTGSGRANSQAGFGLHPDRSRVNPSGRSGF